MNVSLSVIRPKKMPVYDLRAFERDVQQALDETGQAILDDFQRTTSTWETKVEFSMSSDFRVGSRNASVIVGTDSDVYQWVSLGTRPHFISARYMKVLRFFAPYGAKTSPGFLDAGESSEGEGPYFKQVVKHPGIQPRHFEEQIAEKHMRLGTLERNLQDRWRQTVEGQNSDAG